MLFNWCLKNKQVTTSSNRLEWLDILKGLGIIMVVIGHTKTPLSTIIYSFHMPLFFIVAGFLFNYTKYKYQYKQFMVSKFKRLVIPYLISSLFIFYPFWYFLGRHYGKAATLDTSPVMQFIGIFYATGISKWMEFNLPPWFLTCMFVSLIVFWWINNVTQNINRMIIYTVIISSIGYIMSHYVMLPWSIDIALAMQIFMLAGMYLRKCDLTNRLLWLSILALVFSIYINGRVDTASRHYQNVICYYLGGIAGTILFIKLSLFINNILNKTCISRFIAFCGKNSLMILLFHSMGFKFASSFFVYVMHLQLQEAQVMYWPVYSMVSLLFCTLVILAKKQIDNRLKNNNIWNTYFMW